jgi:pyruvate dehydrogenase E2 component (dihydrolipoamide acetyltransferase)
MFWAGRNDRVQDALAGSDMDEGTLNEWLVHGDTVRRGQGVAVWKPPRRPSRSSAGMRAPLHELLVPVGQTVQVGTVMATLLAPGETAEPPPMPATTAAAESSAPQPMPAVAAPARPAGHRAAGRRHRQWVSPAARRVAEKLGVDIGVVTGTRPQGAVTIADVEKASAAAAKPTVIDRAANMRRSIAAAISRSKREIPHYYLAQEIPMDTALSWLTGRNAQRSITERLLPAVLQLKAVGLAAARFGEFNGFWRDDESRPAQGVHVGVAISLRGGGLVAPAIHDVADKKLDVLMNDLTGLVARARAGSLRSSEMSEPSITVTNLGDQGVDVVFGVIYPRRWPWSGLANPPSVRRRAGTRPVLAGYPCASGSEWLCVRRILRPR